MVRLRLSAVHLEKQVLGRSIFYFACDLKKTDLVSLGVHGIQGAPFALLAGNPKAGWWLPRSFPIFPGFCAERGMYCCISQFCNDAGTGNLVHLHLMIITRIPIHFSDSGNVATKSRPVQSIPTSRWRRLRSTG